MVMQIACGVEHANGVVDHRHSRTSMAHILRQLGAVVRLWQHTFAQRLRNTITQVVVHVLKVFTPTQLKNELVLNPQSMLVVHSTCNIRHAQKSMGQVRRQMRDRAIQGITRMRIVFGADMVQPQLSGLGRGWKFVHKIFAIVPCLLRYTFRHAQPNARPH